MRIKLIFIFNYIFLHFEFMYSDSVFNFLPSLVIYIKLFVDFLCKINNYKYYLPPYINSIIHLANPIH